MTFRLLLSALTLVLGWMVNFSGSNPAGILSPPSCEALSSLTEVHVLPRITTARKQVFLLDLCDPGTLPADWRGLMAQVDIGEAPAVGSEKFIEAQHLKAYLSQFIDTRGGDSSKVRLHIPDRVTVARQTMSLSQQQIEGIFRHFVLDHTPWPAQDTVIQKINVSGSTVVPAGTLTHEVVPDARERFIGNVAVTMHFYVDGEKASSLTVSGRVDVYQTVLHASRALKQNDIITPADLEYQRISIAESSDRYATQPDQILNKRLLRNVGMHQAFDLRLLDKPLAVKRGAAVNIIYNQPGLQVSAKGQAREEGSIGDTIRINNVTSNRIVFCQVINSETVQAVR